MRTNALQFFPGQSVYYMTPGLLAQTTQYAGFTRIQERNSVRATLKEISCLPPNWDGHGGLAVTKEAIDHALIFLLILEAKTPTLENPEITPTSSGTIAMEWETEFGEAYLEIGKTRFSFFARSGSGPQTLREGLADEIGLVSELIESALSPAWSTALYGTVFSQLDWQTFEVNYVDPIKDALVSMQPPAISINKVFVQGSIQWSIGGNYAEHISYYTPEPVPASIYSEGVQLALAA
jgi:hypothetical protein